MQCRVTAKLSIIALIANSLLTVCLLQNAVLISCDCFSVLFVVFYFARQYA